PSTDAVLLGGGASRSLVSRFTTRVSGAFVPVGGFARMGRPGPSSDFETRLRLFARLARPQDGDREGFAGAYQPVGRSRGLRLRLDQPAGGRGPRLQLRAQREPRVPRVGDPVQRQ